MYLEHNITALCGTAVSAGADDEEPDECIVVDTEFTTARRHKDSILPRLTPADAAPKALARQAGSRLTIRWAHDNTQLEAARLLVRKMYQWRGYLVDDQAGIGADRVTFVASDQPRTLATISVGLDAAHGRLAAETLYPELVARLRRQGARLCEFTGLALEKVGQSQRLLAMMFHIAYIYAHRLMGYTDVLVEINPRHVAFYEKMLGLRQIGPERICPRVQAPAVLMWLPLSYAAEQIDRFGGRGPSDTVRSLYPLFFSPAQEARLAGRLTAVR